MSIFPHSSSTEEAFTKASR